VTVTVEDEPAVKRARPS